MPIVLLILESPKYVVFDAFSMHIGLLNIKRRPHLEHFRINTMIYDDDRYLSSSNRKIFVYLLTAFYYIKYL